MSEKAKGPVVLQLAPLPREQVGPFLLLGLDKLAGKEEIEAHWAQRVIWARKSQSKVPLEDINWARETITDVERRIRADAASLNVDTCAGVLRRLAEHYAGKTPQASGCAPLDVEKPLAGYTPPTEVPDLNDVRASITVPDVPLEFPIVDKLLEEFLAEPLDPWALRLGSGEDLSA
jgi:hypothetical protein